MVNMNEDFKGSNTFELFFYMPEIESKNWIVLPTWTHFWVLSVN